MTISNDTLPAIENLATIFGCKAKNAEHQNLIGGMKQAMLDEIGPFRNTKYSPDLTLNIFVRQAMSEDHSCRHAIADAAGDGLLELNTLDTGAYCHARKKLPESLFRRFTGITHHFCYDRLHQAQKRWHGFHLKTVDGTTISMPDTPENQEVYPQPDTQAEGIGFPILRMVMVFCLMTGAIINYAYAAYKGKKTGEHSIFRAILDGCVQSQDLIMGDQYYPSYWLLSALLAKGAAGVFEAHNARNVDFRTGKKLGTRDHIVIWKKPIRPKWMTEEEYEKIPDSIKVREFRYGKKTIVTTIRDNEKFSKKCLGKLYLQRWCVETDIGTIKTTMQMDILRCKTPANIAREIGAHVVAYNLTRAFISRTSRLSNCKPRDISHKSALQLFDTFKHQLLNASSEENFEKTVKYIMHLLSHEKVNNRPGRKEPRAVKRRPKAYPRLNTQRRKFR